MGSFYFSKNNSSGIDIWNLKNNEIVDQLPDYAARTLRAMAFSKDESVFATAYDDGLINIWVDAE